MIFAAGFGTRMRPLTDTLPKPLIQIGDTTLLDHTMGLATAAGLDVPIVNAHYLSDQISAHLSEHAETAVIHENPILDTGGGLKNAASRLSGDFAITTNSDNIWNGPNPFTTALSAWQPSMPACLLCAKTENTVGRIGPGDFSIDGDGKLTRGGDYVFLGVQIIDKTLVTAIPDEVFSMNRVWDVLIAQGSLFGAVYDGTWCDVGKPENIPLAQRVLNGENV